ncbi:MAG: cupin domain-containing protein [Alphaproteobacteria bacterium]|nr:cupin domain-containing protein [Alphaproteobacteria bacterium]MCB9697532.1 cupin domain-containing protein [Alphaproteobacteria bacterium]
MLLPLLSLALAAEPAPAGVVSAASAPAFRIADGKGTATLLLGPSTGSTRAAVDTLTFDVGAAVPAHRHETSDELLVVVRGRVEVTIGGVVSTAGPGDAVLVPQGVEHAAKVLEAADLVQVYVGPGPEDRFRAAPPVSADTTR